MSYLYGIVSVGVAPLRDEAKDSAQMVSQLLLGECFEVISIQERWVEIKADDDHYRGWISRVQVQFLNSDHYYSWINNSEVERSPYRTFRASNDERVLFVPFGSKVKFGDFGISLPFGEFQVTKEPELIKSGTPIDTAIHFLGVPYLWGGRCDLGIDCSGFVQIVFQSHGFKVPRDAREQVTAGAFLSSDIKEAKRGDILYFGDLPEKITHVAFYLGKGTILHASGWVKYNNLDYDLRYENPYHYDERLANKLQFIQDATQLMYYRFDNDLNISSES